MEGTLAVSIEEVDITLAVDEEWDETIVVLLVSSLDVAVQWSISIGVQHIVILTLKQYFFNDLP